MRQSVATLFTPVNISVLSLTHLRFKQRVSTMLGGHSAPKVPDAETAAVLAGLRPQLEAANGGKAFSTWEVVEYTSQVVAGMIYKVRQASSTQLLKPWS